MALFFDHYGAAGDVCQHIPAQAVWTAPVGGICRTVSTLLCSLYTTQPQHQTWLDQETFIALGLSNGVPYDAAFRLCHNLANGEAQTYENPNPGLSWFCRLTSNCWHYVKISGSLRERMQRSLDCQLFDEWYDFYLLMRTPIRWPLGPVQWLI
jgi:hypothetical protein